MYVYIYIYISLWIGHSNLAVMKQKKTCYCIRNTYMHKHNVSENRRKQLRIIRNIIHKHKFDIIHEHNEAK